MQFRDRRDAGNHLAQALRAISSRAGLLVLGLPRGGVPVAAVVADRFEAELDLFVVRKVGVPGHEELAMGAVASTGVTVCNDDVLRTLRLDRQAFEDAARAKHEQVARLETEYRGERPGPSLEGRCTVLVDDGLATGASMKAAVEAARKRHPRQLVVAIPVAASRVADQFREFLSEPGESLVCVHEPTDFEAVGRWYGDFRQVEDDEVRRLLADGFARTNPR